MVVQVASSCRAITVMTVKAKKIIVDMGMAIFIVLSFIRWEGNPLFHIIVGTVCTAFLILHILLHRKWLVAQTKKFFRGKASIKVTRLYVIDMLLLVAWSISIMTGFLAIQPYLIESESVLWFGRIHGLTARLGAVLVIAHFLQHLKQIRSYFRSSAKASQ